MQNMKRIVGIGGCHLEGYPLGKEHSFFSKFSAKVAPDAATVIQAHVGIKRLGRALEAHGPFGPSDCVILQLGHFETIRPLFPKFGKQGSSAGASLASTPSSASQNIAGQKQRFGLIPRALYDRLKKAARLSLFTLRELAGRPDFHAEPLERMMEEAIAQSDLRAAGAVVVLSAFPTVDRATNVYRQRLNQAMRAICQRHGYVYVDGYDAVMQARAAGTRILEDDIHLSAASHDIAADQCVAAVVAQGFTLPAQA